MNDDRTYGNLVEAFGEEIREYTVLEHGDGYGEGTAVIDPHIGGYEDTSMQSLADFGVEMVESIDHARKGVSQYDVEGADDLTADEAIEEIIGQTTRDTSPNRLIPSTV